jgi:phosphate-selective porin OprO/OprP
MPFGLEETTSTTDLDFIFRTRGSDALAPARDIGVMVHGRAAGLFEYAAGTFRSDGENARLTEPVFVLPDEIPPTSGRSIAGRIIVTPWGRGGRARPRLGVAVTSSTVAEGLNSLRGRSVFGSEFFDRNYVLGPRTRLGAEAEWSPGRWGLRAEYIRVTEGRERQGLGDVDLSDLIAQSWYVSGTWVITGEKKAGGVEPPRRPLFQGGAGAFEVGARMESVRFSSASREGPAFTNPRAEHVAPSGERVWTTGVTWFWNRWFRIQVNAIREVFDDPERSPAPGTRGFWSGVFRSQLVI